MAEKVRKTVDKVFESVRPYISDSDNLRENVNQAAEPASDKKEFIENFEDIMDKIDDPSKKTDCKIFLNKFESR